jgi:hypothetical protein
MWLGGTMKNEQSSVVFRVPDFVDADGIEVIVEKDGGIRDTVQLVKTLERPLKERKRVRPRNGKLRAVERSG